MALRDWLARKGERPNNQTSGPGGPTPWRVPPEPQTATRTFIVPFNPPLKTGTGKEYAAGISDEQLHGIQVESGQEGLHNPDIWGKNARDYNIEDMLRAGHEVNVGLTGHDFRGQLQQLDEHVESLGEETENAEQVAWDAVDEEGDLALEREGLHVQMAAEGIEPPAEGRHRSLWAGLLFLFFADLGLLSLSAAVFGISDDQFLGIPFLSETALSASGWVTALVLLAHFAAKQLKTGIHFLKAAPLAVPTQKEQ